MSILSSTNLKIVFAYLTSRMKQSVIAVLSVTFGISMYIFMNGFMSGVNDIQSDLAFSTLAHININNDEPEERPDLMVSLTNSRSVINIRNQKVIQYTEGIKNSRKYVDILSKNPNVSVVAPEVNISGFFKSASVRVNGLVSGVAAEKHEKLFGLPDYIISGDWSDLDKYGDVIVVGKGLSERLGVSLHDNIAVQTADGVTKNFKVVAVLETGITSVDNTKAYVEINAARQLLSKNLGYVTDIQVNLYDYDKADEVALELDHIIPYKVESWQSSNEQMVVGNELRNIIAIAVSFTILIVAGFGIYNIMNMTVNEKIKEIAILKAMGFDGPDVIEIFLLQSIIIGLLGGAAGVMLGYGISVFVDTMPFKLAMLDTLPVSYRLIDYFLACLFGLVTTFVAGYLPAKSASEVDPVEIIRG